MPFCLRAVSRTGGLPSFLAGRLGVHIGARDPAAPYDLTLVLMAGHYSVTKAPEQSTRPGCSLGLRRFTLVKRFAEFCASGKLGRLTATSWCCLSGNPHPAHKRLKFSRLWEVGIWMFI